MQNILLLSKFRRAIEVEVNLHYECSREIDDDLLITAEMHEFEKIVL